jgi:hypothetical protein
VEDSAAERIDIGQVWIAEMTPKLPSGKSSFQTST